MIIPLHCGQKMLPGEGRPVWRVKCRVCHMTGSALDPLSMRLWLRTPDVASCDAIFDINDVTQSDIDRLKQDLADTRAKAEKER